ncbi:MAG: VCBS repeat-containing protein [Acidobacteria bacterium]|nr:VCBS repeat-containing protein [Acidobacteriota bacterium]
MKVACLATGAALALMSAVAPSGAPAAGPVQWAPHDIDADFRGGYAVGVADFNRDGRPDVIANSLAVSEVAWYENPSWARHVVVTDQLQVVNQAMEDIDGDGIPEIAFQNAFAMQPARSEGLTWIARHQGDPRQPWKVERVDAYPTSHHVVWADLDGDGTRELVNAPLIGPKGLAPTYDQDQAPIFWYGRPDWTRHVVTEDIPGIIHRVRVVKWDGGARDRIVVASFEGIALYRATGAGAAMRFEKQLLSPGHVGKAPRLGASDVGIGTQDGRRFFASVEPWHGNEVVIYTQTGDRWRRRVIFDKVGSGHEIAVLDLNGDGRDDVIANDNSRPTERNPSAPLGGVHVFYAPDDAASGPWPYQRLEGTAAMNGCVGADLNADQRPDLVCTGASGKVRWYENRGRDRGQAAGSPPPIALPTIRVTPSRAGGAPRLPSTPRAALPNRRQPTAWRPEPPP